ncbi:MAG: T9SS type A sorting domain-containing protein [Bacteroidia bacterium]|nr:T9SS type A sorting domain-containing protein [Bacteroidia bacterium]
MNYQKLIIQAVALFTTLFCVATAEAQEVHLLHDITLEEDPALGSSPGPFVTLDSIVLFRAQTAEYTNQIWRTNGTESGTRMVKELPFYENLGSSISFTKFNSKVYFNVVNPEYGYQMWVTDGTQNGTKPVFDASQDENISSIYHITPFKGRLYFVAANEDIGREIWRTDSAVSSAESFDLIPGNMSSSPFNLTVSKDRLYFLSNSQQSNGPVLQVTDGVGFDTIKFENNFERWQITHLIPNSSGLYFYVMEYRGTGQELWHTDGTASGTRRVKSISQKGQGFSQSPSLFKTIDEKLYFYANTPQYGREIWVTDGTDTGTHILVDMVEGRGSSYGANDVVKYKDELFFALYVPSRGVELVKYNPSSDSLQVVTDIFDTDSISVGVNAPFILLNDKLIFQGQDSVNNWELWYTDGTEDGTHLFADINPKGSSNAWLWHPIGNQYLFSATDGVRGRELWITDGTTSGTRLLKNIRTTRLSTIPRRLTPFSNSLGFLIGKFPSVGIGIVEDDSIRSFDFLDTIDNGGTVRPTDLIGVNNTLLFRGESEKHGAELWKTDGTQPGTELVRDFVPGSAGSSPLFFTKMNDEVYFRVDNSVIPNSLLYKTDGTKDNTVLAGSLWEEYGRATITKIFATEDKVFFFAQTSELGNELFVSDGTLKGTRLVKDICQERCSGPLAQEDVVVNNGVIYFPAISLNRGEELWRSDGTKEGTYLIKDLNGTTMGSKPRMLGSFKNQVFFATEKNRYTHELWKTDGTEEGTQIFPNVFVNIDLQGGFFQKGPTRGVQMKDAFYFVAKDYSDLGYELWRSDGSEEGTRMVKDIAPGSYGSNPNHLTVLNDTLYFVATTLEHGSELWKSDGTEENTKMVSDILPNGASSNPTDLTTIGNRLYFAASHLEHGRELFYLEDPNYKPKSEKKEETKSQEIRFHVSPVPAGDELHVAWGDIFNRDFTSRSLMVYDILGRPVIAQTVSGGYVTISLTGVTSGTYILKLEGIGATKFIKH